jgi:hypothetical protein
MQFNNSGHLYKKIRWENCILNFKSIKNNKIYSLKKVPKLVKNYLLGTFEGLYK